MEKDCTDYFVTTHGRTVCFRFSIINVIRSRMMVMVQKYHHWTSSNHYSERLMSNHCIIRPYQRISWNLSRWCPKKWTWSHFWINFNVNHKSTLHLCSVPLLSCIPSGLLFDYLIADRVSAIHAIWFSCLSQEHLLFFCSISQLRFFSKFGQILLGVHTGSIDLNHISFWSSSWSREMRRNLNSFNGKDVWSRWQVVSVDWYQIISQRIGCCERNVQRTWNFTGLKTTLSEWSILMLV